MKVAVVHDWLDAFGGAEVVLENILSLYEGADLYLVVDFMTVERRSKFDKHRIFSSFIQRLPFARKHFRRYLPLMPLAIRQFDLSGYDLILSSSHCVAKAVKSHTGQMHICYCHTPMRYIWDMAEDYLQNHGITGLKAVLARALSRRLRQWDRQTGGVDVFIANSQFIADRIRRYYDRDAVVVYPPVAVESFNDAVAKEDYYVTVSRLVSQKKVELIVEAFNRMPDRQLIVIGSGPRQSALRCMAGRNITVIGALPTAELAACLSRARGFVFASLEDFGIVMVEAQAAGTPVIAYAQGGSREIVRDDTGLFFEEQSVASIVDAVGRFEADKERFSPEACRQNAQRFDTRIFLESYTEVIRRALDRDGLPAGRVGIESLASRNGLVS